MKNWNWKQWTVFGVVVAFIITFIILLFVKPIISFSIGVGFIIGVICTIIFMKNKDKYKELKQVEEVKQ